MYLREPTSWERVLVALDTLKPQLLDEDAYGNLRSILHESFERGRIDRVLDNEAGMNHEKYVIRVYEYYQQEYSLVSELKSNLSSEKWGEIYAKTLDIAQRFLQFKCQLPMTECLQHREDYAQEATFEILQSPYAFDTSFTAWMTQVAYNICRNKARSSQTEKGKVIKNALPIDDRIVDTYHSFVSPEAQMMERETIEQVVEAVSHLSEQEQALVLNLYVEEQSQTEYAKHLNVHSSTVSRRESRVLNTLRQNIETERYSIDEDK